MASNRITEKDLQALCLRINEATKSPTQTYVNGKAQIGNYHVSHAYGGVCLHRIHNEGGGVTTPLKPYHAPKRELYDAMQAFLAGLGHA